MLKIGEIIGNKVDWFIELIYNILYMISIIIILFSVLCIPPAAIKIIFFM